MRVAKDGSRVEEKETRGASSMAGKTSKTQGPMTGCLDTCPWIQPQTATLSRHRPEGRQAGDGQSE